MNLFSDSGASDTGILLNTLFAIETTLLSTLHGLVLTLRFGARKIKFLDSLVLFSFFTTISHTLVELPKHEVNQGGSWIYVLPSNSTDGAPIASQDSSQPRVAVNFVSSAMAAAGATLLTQPADVTRTRMQLGMGSGGRFAAFSTLQHLVMVEGVRGMMTGVYVCLLTKYMCRAHQSVHVGWIKAIFGPLKGILGCQGALS